jgi:superfamily I DNA and/or RNA helicase
MCTSDPEYASEAGNFIFSPNRLNVAVSRARSKVAIFASEGVLDALPTDYEGLLALKQFRACLARISVQIPFRSNVPPKKLPSDF